LLKRLHAARKSDVARGNEDLESLRYPVFVRSERDHVGNLSPLLATPAEARDALGAALLQGYSLQDLMVVEFCSTADAHGVFRKYAAYNVGGRILGRSLNAGRQWMLKLETSDFTRDLVIEDQRYVTENPHVEQLADLLRVREHRLWSNRLLDEGRPHSDVGNQRQSNHRSRRETRRRFGAG
jgi:hypothetical protein